MVLVVDNYDSFVHNLARYLVELGAEVAVERNDAITLAEVERRAPRALVLSPGPCDPERAGICVPLVRHFAGHVPILGICLGHQAIAAAFGARIERGPPVHGRTSEIHHDGRGLFRSLPSPFRAARYHSLRVAAGTLPDELEVSARAADGTIMALRHRTWAVAGVQFHPESILSEHGYRLLRSFLEGIEATAAARRRGAAIER